MALIAKHANVGMGTIYNYFPSKEELITELFRTLRIALYTDVFIGYPNEAPIRERFFHIWRRLCRYYLAHPKEFVFLERYAYSPFIDQSRVNEVEVMVLPIVQLFEQAKQQQIVKDIPLNVFIPLVTGSLTSIIRSHIVGMITIDTELLEMTLNMCWDAVRR